MLTEKGMKAREKLGPIFDKEAVKVVYSVSDEAVAVFAGLAFDLEDDSPLFMFLESCKRQDFIAAYLQDQQRPERFEVVTNFLSSPVKASSPMIVLDNSLRMLGTFKVTEMFMHLSQNPEHLAKFLAKREVMETLMDRGPDILEGCFNALRNNPTLLLPLKIQREDIRLERLRWQLGENENLKEDEPYQKAYESHREELLKRIVVQEGRIQSLRAESSQSSHPVTTVPVTTTTALKPAV